MLFWPGVMNERNDWDGNQMLVREIWCLFGLQRELNAFLAGRLGHEASDCGGARTTESRIQ
jgi:hypothetical protein